MSKDDLIMPFGKYKGRSLYTLPSSYLLWIAENLHENTPLNKKIVIEADTEYQFREKHNNHHYYE